MMIASRTDNQRINDDMETVKNQTLLRFQNQNVNDSKLYFVEIFFNWKLVFLMRISYCVEGKKKFDEAAE